MINEANNVIQKNWQELIKPNKLDIQPGRDAQRVATVVAEPLERGFGLTLGNALRRVLLSSLQGAAVTSVQIDGVLHEFSSVAGVREDVTDVVLNLKGVAIRMEVEVIFKNSYPEFFSDDTQEKIAMKLINDLITQLIDPNIFYSRFSFFESGRDAINIKYSVSAHD